MTKRFARTRRMLVAVALLVSSVGVAVSSSGEVLAGSGLNRWRWGDAGMTLSSSSYKYSNMSGFWQAVVNSNGCNIAIDGIYGNITTWYKLMTIRQLQGVANQETQAERVSGRIGVHVEVVSLGRTSSWRRTRAPRSVTCAWAISKSSTHRSRWTC
jgi:hypothetical protein